MGKIALEMLKNDLGITADSRDTYFEQLLEASEKELLGKGIILKTDDVHDAELVADYTTWKYRNRQENIGLSQNLQLRIRNRIIKERAK